MPKKIADKKAKKSIPKTKVIKKGKGRKEKKVKDKNAPKKPRSAFFCYQMERRPKLGKEQPSLGNKDIIRTMSQEWNGMVEKDREPYMKLAVKDKERYKKAIVEYEKKKKTEDPKKSVEKKKA